VVFVRMQEGVVVVVVVKSSGDTISSPNGCRTSYGYGDDEI
jgi:hypothetical protein